MKFNLTKDEWEALSEPMKELYKAKGSGYQLDVDITKSDDYQSLYKNRNEILDEKKEEEKKRLESEDAKEKDHLKNLEEKQEYEKLLGIKTDKFKTDLKESGELVFKLQKQLEESIMTTAVDNLALALAGTNAELMKPHIKSRLTMQEVDGVQKLFVKDVTGTASAMTLEQLGKEFEGNTLFAPILQGRQSSGGGGNTNTGTGGGDFTSFGDNEAHFKPETRNLTKQAELQAKDPELYKKLSEKYNTGGRARMYKQVG